MLRRLEFHYVPKHASWLNMVEIEISVLATQCLDQRIESYTRLLAETAAWEKQRNAARARVNWMFTTEKARAKMGRAYPKPAPASAAPKSQNLCAEVRGPGSRCARPGHERGARARRVRSRGARSAPLAVSAFTMSNSTVLFVPAARCARGLSLSFSRPPQRGAGGAPTGALVLMSRG